MSARRRLAIELSAAEGSHCVRLLGLPRETRQRLATLGEQELAREFPVYPREHLAGEAPDFAPMAGRYEVDSAAVTFVPRYPLVPGLDYAMGVHADGGEPQRLAFRLPSDRGAPTTEVLATYPSGGRLVRNQLKLYIQFSASMSEGQVGQHLHLVRDDSGEPIEDPFVPEPELWDRDRRRLTLLFDPGRLKRGLLPQLEAGYPLQEGVAVRLVVDDGFRDADGNPLREPFERRYEVGGDLRARVDPRDWEFRPPAAGTAEALHVRFDRPLDHALLQHCIEVRDDAGRPVRGHPQVGPAERSWAFTPAAPWPEGDYRLAIDPRLEDLAGNSLTRLFDRDLERDEATVDAARTSISFAVRARLEGN
ncbi:MAG: hypothetical protein F4Z25_04280 [Chloroflexi bacterium]|nr:hypothetical protein [Chloroflexota bacterium]